MAAASPVWNTVLKKNSLAVCYNNGEPKFNLLSMLFGHPEMKTETKTEVILISDSTKSLQDGGGRLDTRVKAMKAMSGEGTDSVCSPDGDLIRRLENAYPLRPSKPCGDHKDSLHASSCGSSTPATWWQHYAQ
ncbi:uncharacterized protein LOC121799400 [Salvia splendens]|uniref:uncharacterized protein LOC121799400 n=1 Tax=Salvia splendens TaxID=180675 RepID=UPI001C25A5A7|nr:uncharacterized protein LOC121799400 [Salvia splendens]